MELVIAGTADIDIKDWRKNTDYRSGMRIFSYRSPLLFLIQLYSLFLFLISLTRISCRVCVCQKGPKEVHWVTVWAIVYLQARFVSVIFFLFNLFNLLHYSFILRLPWQTPSGSVVLGCSWFVSQRESSPSTAGQCTFYYIFPLYNDGQNAVEFPEFHMIIAL